MAEKTGPEENTALSLSSKGAQFIILITHLKFVVVRKLTVLNFLPVISLHVHFLNAI